MGDVLRHLKVVIQQGHLVPFWRNSMCLVNLKFLLLCQLIQGIIPFLPVCQKKPLHKYLFLQYKVNIKLHLSKHLKMQYKLPMARPVCTYK